MAACEVISLMGVMRQRDGDVNGEAVRFRESFDLRHRAEDAPAIFKTPEGSSQGIWESGFGISGFSPRLWHLTVR